MSDTLAALQAVLATAAVGALVWFVGANLAVPERRLNRRPRRLYSTQGASFRRALGALLGPPIVSGNAIETLRDGEQIFPAMLSAIDSARSTITFETFVFRDDIALRFRDALAAAAGRGVRVHVLLDWLGARTAVPTAVDTLRAAGAEVELYHPPTWFHLGRLNNRTHRKLLVIDGRLGFTGGVGIGREWVGADAGPGPWRENHYRVRGAVVAQMQAVFVDNWIKATGNVLHGAEYFPPLEPVGAMDAQMFASSPAGGSESMHLMVMLAITAAHRSIDIVNSYFVPDEMTIDALIAARRRGVRVRILVPNRHTDAPLGRRAAQALYDPLLAAGVELFEYQPTMLHAKLMVVDGAWASVGSGNFDDRSFRLNDEANLNVFDEAFAAEQVRFVEEDLEAALPISRRRWARRPWGRRVAQQAALLLRSQL